MIVVMSGGVGGARLANGLAAIVPPGHLLIAVNVGDDFDHLGLRICPDLDTVTHTLAGLNDRERGWGVCDETWSFMEALGRLGGPDWFALGDRDLAKHVLRTDRLSGGATLSTVTADFAAAWGIAHTIVPVSDDPIRTMVDTDEGELSFQDYFVRRRCQPQFRGIRFAGAEAARPSADLLAALASPALEAVVIGPSNPLLSIAPILAVPGITEALATACAPRLAISPFIAGEAIKGPAAKIMRELGLEPGASAVAERYKGLIDAVLCDRQDPHAGDKIHGIALVGTDTLMPDDEGQQRLAGEVLALAESIRKP